MRILQAQGRGRRRAAQSGRPEARHGAFTWADATERGLSRATPPRPRWEPRKRTCPLHHPRQVGSQTRFLMKRRGEHPQRLACGKPCRIFHTHVILPGRRWESGTLFHSVPTSGGQIRNCPKRPVESFSSGKDPGRRGHGLDVGNGTSGHHWKGGATSTPGWSAVSRAAAGRVARRYGLPC